MSQETTIPGFETVYICKTDMTDEATKNLKNRLTQIAQQFGGELAYSEDWGKKKLAYPIKKETRGNYFYIVYSGNGDIVTEVERNLRIQESVLRFLSVRVTKEFDKAEFIKNRMAFKKAEEEAAAQHAAERHSHYGRGDYSRGGSYERE